MCVYYHKGKDKLHSYSSAICTCCLVNQASDSSSDRHSVQPRPQPSPCSTAHRLWPEAMRLPFWWSPTCNSCICMDYYSFIDPGGMEGWVGAICTLVRPVTRAVHSPHVCDLGDVQNGAANVGVARLAVLDGLRIPTQRWGTAGDGVGDGPILHAATPRHQVRVRRLACLDWHSRHSALEGWFVCCCCCCVLAR